MNDISFDALAQLLRLRAGPARDAARLVLVQGYTVPDAARACALPYALAYKAVRRCKDGMELVQRICCTE